MDNQLVTVGLPFYNNERTLRAAINSILLQTYSTWELLLVNDGSSDGSLEIARDFAQKDHRITIINDNENKGLVARLNQIIDLAKGAFIARMDADDMMMPDRLKKQIQCFKNDESIEIVATAAYTIDHVDKPIGIRDNKSILATSNKDVISRSLLIHPSILVRTEWFKENRYDPNYHRAEDYELWCRTFSHTKFFRITEPLLIYREGNVSIPNYLASMKTLRRILRNYGPSSLPPLTVRLEIGKTYLKSIVYRIMGLLSLQYVLTAQRNSGLNKSEISKINTIVENIKA